MSILFGQRVLLLAIGLSASFQLVAAELTLADALQRTLQHSPALQPYPYQLR